MMITHSKRATCISHQSLFINLHLTLFVALLSICLVAYYVFSLENVRYKRTSVMSVLFLKIHFFSQEKVLDVQLIFYICEYPRLHSLLSV